jgi:hypothetical protein
VGRLQADDGDEDGDTGAAPAAASTADPSKSGLRRRF